MKFFAFIKSILGDQSTASDVAESIVHDKNFPKDKSDKEMMDYLKQKTAYDPKIYSATEELISKFKAQI